MLKAHSFVCLFLFWGGGGGGGEGRGWPWLLLGRKKSFLMFYTYSLFF